MDDRDDRFDYDGSTLTFDFRDATTEGAYVTEQSVSFTNILLKSKLTFQKNEETLTETKAMDGVTFAVYEGVPDASKEPVATVTTGEDGVAGVATTAPLPIRDASGNLIDYYVVEKDVGADYTVVYPDGNADAWGPIRLDFEETTDRTGKPIVNKKDETRLTVKKTDTDNQAIAGATFTVQNSKNNKYAVLGEDGTVTWQDDEATLTTNDSGQIVLSGIPAGTYIVTEKSVPDAYLSTGTVTGADAGPAVTDGQALSGQVTLVTLGEKIITFQNDRKPVLQFTKRVPGGVTGDFTFELYKANAKGTAPEGGQIGEDVTVAADGTGVFTVDEAGKYFLKETGWPAGVIAPSIIHTKTGNGVYVDGTDVYYVPYELENNQTTETTIQNTANTGSLTIKKTDAKTEEPLAGATFTVSVDTAGWSEDLRKLLPSGFKAVEGSTTYTLTTGTTNANGQVTVGKLPLYNDKDKIEYTVVEATAPENYIQSGETQTATPANENEQATPPP